MKWVNVFAAFAMNMAAVYISVGHTFDLFYLNGFSKNHAIAATFMVETMFIVGGWNIMLSRFRNHKPSTPSYLGFYFGWSLVLWSNIAATLEYGIQGVTLSVSVVLTVLITEAIMTAETKKIVHKEDAAQEETHTQEEDAQDEYTPYQYGQKEIHTMHNEEENTQDTYTANAHDLEEVDEAHTALHKVHNLAFEASEEITPFTRRAHAYTDEHTELHAEESQEVSPISETLEKEVNTEEETGTRAPDELHDEERTTEEEMHVHEEEEKPECTTEGEMHSESTQKEEAHGESTQEEENGERALLEDLDEIIARAHEYKKTHRKKPSIRVLMEYAPCRFSPARRALNKIKKEEKEKEENNK